MKRNYLDSIPDPSKEWLTYLSADECRQLQRWIKIRLKYLHNIPSMERRIDDLPISFRARTALKLHNLRTVEDIIHCGFDKIALFKNIGVKTVVEIQKAITV